MPKIIILIETFSHLSLTWLININDFDSCFSFLNCYRDFFQFGKFDDDLFEKFFIILMKDFRFFFLFLFFLNSLESLNERFCGNDFHQFERKYCYFVSFDIFFNHSCKLDDFISTFFLFVLNLSCNFKRLMLFTKDQVLDFF